MIGPAPIRSTISLHRCGMQLLTSARLYRIMACRFFTGTPPDMRFQRDEEVCPLETSLRLPESSHTGPWLYGAGESQLRQMAGTLKKRFQAPPSVTPAAEAKRSGTLHQFSNSVSEALSATPVAQTFT